MRRGVLSSKEVGFAQSFVVALTPSTFALCGTLNSAVGIGRHGQRIMRGFCEAKLPFAKFAVLYLLLQSVRQSGSVRDECFLLREASSHVRRCERPNGSTCCL